MIFSSSKGSQRIYSLRKSRHILKTSLKWYKKRHQDLTSDQLNAFEAQLNALDQSLLKGNREEASSVAHELEAFCQAHFKKGFIEYALEIAVAVAIALFIAVIVRQMWFEPFEIPTGSMRPTFKEQDRLTVTKTAFGINCPLATNHLYFDPNLVQRTSVFIWSGDGIPHLDSESTFLGIFPYTKRYIKRCMGKPGDFLYFYGGQIYGVDKDGNELPEYRNSPWLSRLEYIPFMNFQGRESISRQPKQSQTIEALFHLINQPIGRMTFQKDQTSGEIFNGKEWIQDKPTAQQKPHRNIETYSDFFGMRNFAMTRLLTKKQVEQYTDYDLDKIGDGVLYLELRHTPNLVYPHPLVSSRYEVILTGYQTLLPLQQEHIDALIKNMYTARFVVKDGRADRYREQGAPRFSPSSPLFPQVPDGTYEFYYGKAYEIKWQGIACELAPDHPLYSNKPTHVQKLFNIGIEMTNEVAPHQKNQPFFPNRYGYFREGDFYLLGAPILKKEDSSLQKFLEDEKKRELESKPQSPYVAFRDYGPPLNAQGGLDKEFIQTFGYHVPDKHYLALGDNHAMSQDSRYFGPLPEANLQGAPSLILWPPGHRWGIPDQKPYPLLNIPRLIVWCTAGFIFLVWYLIHRRNLKKPQFKKINSK